MAYLEEITTYKNKLMQALCTSDGIVQMMRLDGETVSGKDMRYKKIFPYAYVPDTSQKADKYVCFEVRALSASSGVIKGAEIYTYAFTHQTLMRTDDGIFPDVLSSKIDRILNGSDGYGLSKIELRSSDVFSPNADYHGRRNIYYVKDLNRACGDF